MVARRDWRGWGASVLVGVTVALPWMWGMSYSRGYDFFLWVYNAWYLGESIGWGDLPNWSPYAACGQPFYKVAGLSDSAMLASLMQAAGVFGGLRIFVLLAYIVASVGLYQLARSLDLNRGAAWLAAAAYVMSWFLTFTVYFQAYLSNLLVYALLPWFVYWVRTSIAERAAWSLWAATAALATCALANPQVAIKIVLIGVWLTLPLMLRGSKWIWWGVWSGIGLVALTFVVFDVVSALRLRSEVLTINARANSYVGPFTLVAVPAFVFGLLIEWLGGERWPGMELWELLYAEHPGLVAVVLAVMALVWERKIMVTLLWGGVAVGYALFFFVLPYLPASPWLGISHNIMIVPVFGLALLSGFGATALRCRLILLWDERRAQWASAAVAVLLAIEGYGLLMGLKQWGTSGIEPRDLPEVAVWKELAEPMRADGGNTRFFTFNPDWTIGLFPVVTGLPTANVIELRQRSADYQAYLDLIVRCSKTPDCRIQPSRLLAPLNVSYVDVPLKYYTYVSPNQNPVVDAGATSGTAVFDRDPHLHSFIDRAVTAADMGRRVAAKDWLPGRAVMAAGGSRALAQVVYENGYRLPAFVASRTIAIVGDHAARRDLFARIAALPSYDPGRILPLMLGSLDGLPPEALEALVGFIGGAATDSKGIPRLGMRQVEDLYRTEEGRPMLQHWRRANPELLQIDLEAPLAEGRYLFVSHQRFSDWHAFYGDGTPAPIMRAVAGLTAVFVAAGRQTVTLEYRLPAVERWSRWFYGLGVVAATVGTLLWERRQKVVEKNRV